MTPDSDRPAAASGDRPAHPLDADLEHVLAHTRGLWEELRGQRLFITGGTGFFGCWMLESFTHANDRLGLDASVTVLTRRPEAFRAKAPRLADHPSVHLHSGDVLDFEYPKGGFSHVVHAATESSSTLNAEDPLRMFDTIVAGTRRVLDFAVGCGARKLLLTSSGAVYGRQPPELTHVPEDHVGAPDPLDPASAYGEGKRAAELLCALYHRRHNLHTKIARCFAFVGPHLPLDVHYAVGNFIRDALAGGPIRVKGDGSPYRSYLYAADLAIWLWTILQRGQPARAYNVGSGAALTIAQLAHLVAESFDPEARVCIGQRAPSSGPSARYVPSIAKAKEELGLEPWITCREGIRRTLEWHRQ